MGMPKEIDFNFFLAPMVGITHVATRTLIARYIPEGRTTIWPTEMLSSYKLVKEEMGQTPETLKGSCDNFIMPQLLANDEAVIRVAVKKLENWGASGVDINMGCPVRKALKHNYGVALMGDPTYAAEVVAMAKRSTAKYVSVKIRSGLQKNDETLLNLAEKIQKAGADWVCLHPRFATEKRRGKSDWSKIKLVKDTLSLDVVGNGDIQTHNDVFEMLEQTNCNGVMIGRALTAKPWLFWKIGRSLGMPNPRGLVGDPPESAEDEAQLYGESLLFLIDQMQDVFSETEVLKKFLFYVKVSHPWLNFGHSLYQKISACKSAPEIKEQINIFFRSTGLKMSERTELRY